MPNMTVFDEEKSVFFSMAEAGSTVAGGCTQAWWDAEVESIGAAAAMAKLMNVSNGDPIIDATNTVYTQANHRITDTGIHVGVEVGMVAYVDENPPGGNIETGKYTITAVGTDYIECDGIDGSDAPDVDVRIGGAVGGLQYALDETDATNHSVTIYIRSEPILTAQIDADSGGGNPAKNTFKRIVGFNTVPGDMSRGGAYYQSPLEILQAGSIDHTGCVLLDADDEGITILDFDGTDNVIFENFHFYNTDQSAITFSSVVKNITFRNCRFSAVYKPWVGDADGVLIDSCYTHDDIAHHVYFCSGGEFTFLNCVGKVAAVRNLFTFSSSSGAVIGCVVVGGNFAVRVVGSDSRVLVRGNTFYDTLTYGVCNDGGNMIVFNNIFCLAPGAAGIYLRTNGGSISYNDYNCFIESDAAPLTVGGAESDYEVPVIGAHSVQVDPDFVDTANGGFRARNPLLLRGGRPGPDGRAAVIGAIGQEYQFAARARMVNQGRAGIIK